MKYFNSILICFLVVFIFNSCNNKIKFEKTTGISTEIKIDEVTSYNENTNKKPSLNLALELSDSLYRPILIYFYADWCLPCKEMEKNVFGDENVAHHLSRYIFWKLNGETERGSNIRLLYGIVSYPNFCVLNKEGNKISEHNGSASVTEFQHFLRTSLDSLNLPLE